MKEPTIKQLVPGRRDERCLQVLTAIVIPAGTILRQEAGKPGVFSCPCEGTTISLTVPAGTEAPAGFKQVVAA